MSIINRTTEVTAYIASIKRSRILSAEEEIEMVHQYKVGNEAQKKIAKERILESNQLLIYKMAKEQAQNDPANVLDYVNEGNIGLITALDTGDFDATKGFKFISWARYYILREMLNFKNRIHPMINVTNYQKIGSIVPRIICDFIGKNEREPSVEELCDILAERGIKVNEAVDLLPLSVKSIEDASCYGYDASEFGESPEFNKATASYNEIEEISRQEDIKNMVAGFLSQLNEKEKKVISMINGIGYNREYSVDEVAQVMHLTTIRINQIRNEAIAKMKKLAREMYKTRA